MITRERALEKINNIITTEKRVIDDTDLEAIRVIYIDTVDKTPVKIERAVERHIGDKVKMYRLDNRWSQQELADKMGYKSKSTINKIELGKNGVSLRKARQFARVFGCDISELV